MGQNSFPTVVKTFKLLYSKLVMQIKCFEQMDTPHLIIKRETRVTLPTISGMPYAYLNEVSRTNITHYYW